MPLKRIFPALVVLSALTWAQSRLSTIQDTLFKADGTRFNGTLTIRWSTFDAANVGTVIQQSKAVQVVNGNLFVQLVPNAGQAPPANLYQVQYQSDGSDQFSETWTVGVSTHPLTVSEVRIGTVAVTPTAGSGSTTTTPIAESDVVGLVDDLNQRPLKGVAFGSNGVAIVDDSGALETAVGQVGSCVLVDGTTAPCGGVLPVFVDAETPAGTLDGNNTTFTLSAIPSGTSLALYRNGVYMTAGVDYTLIGNSLQFAVGSVPQPADTLTASYRVNPAVAGVIGNPQVSGQVIPVAAAQVICSAAGQTTGSGTSTSLGACDIPAGGLHPGDRIEVRFGFAHSGKASGFDFLINWGSTQILSRHGAPQDVGIVGHADAAISSSGAQLSIESWGTVLSLLPAIVTAPAQNGVQVNLKADVSNPGNDTVTLTNFTVLRYPSR